MSAGFSDAYEAAILDDVFRTPGTGTTRSLYLALYVRNGGSVGGSDGVLPNEDGSGTNGLPSTIVEATGGGYTRKTLTSADFAAAVGGAPTSKSSTSTLSWAASGTAIGEVVGWGLYTASTGGVPILYGPITTSGGTATHQQVNAGDTFGFDSTSPIKMQLGDPSDTFA